jgi:hypothetical protein
MLKLRFSFFRSGPPCFLPGDFLGLFPLQALFPVLALNTLLGLQNVRFAVELQLPKSLNAGFGCSNSLCCSNCSSLFRVISLCLISRLSLGCLFTGELQFLILAMLALDVQNFTFCPFFAGMVPYTYGPLGTMVPYGYGPAYGGARLLNTTQLFITNLPYNATWQVRLSE